MVAERWWLSNDLHHSYLDRGGRVKTGTPSIVSLDMGMTNEEKQICIAYIIEVVLKGDKNIFVR